MVNTFQFTSWVGGCGLHQMSQMDADEERDKQTSHELERPARHSTAPETLMPRTFDVWSSICVHLRHLRMIRVGLKRSLAGNFEEGL